MKKINLHHLISIVALSGVLTACGSDDKNSNATYEIEVTNLTHSQPLSPVGVLIHSEQTHIWSIGSRASVALEDLAEGGSNLALLDSEDEYLQATESGEGLIMPGGYEAISITVANAKSEQYLSLASMLVNTNDGFTGISGLNVSELNNGDSMTLSLGVYDAGTETNDELASTIPGQMGEGFNTERLDTNVVSRHPGVVGRDDGYAESGLTSVHKFDNPAISVTITRTN